MLAMDNIHSIRQLYYEQWKTIPERVFRRLGKEVDGFNCSYRLVAQYVTFRKTQMHLDDKHG